MLPGYPCPCPGRQRSLDRHSWPGAPLHRGHHPGRHHVHVTDGVDRHQQATLPVPVDEGGGGGLVDLEAAANGIFGVVVALHQLPPTGIAGTGHLRRVVDDVVGGAALGAHPPARHALQDLLGAGLEVHHHVDAPRGGHLRQRLGLGHGAREAVQDETGGGSWPEQVLPDHAHDHVVGDELAPVHVGLESTPELGAAGGGGPERIARRHVGRPVDSRKAGCLGPLARSLAPEHHYAKSGVRSGLGHYRRKPS